MGVKEEVGKKPDHDKNRDKQPDHDKNRDKKATKKETSKDEDKKDKITLKKTRIATLKPPNMKDDPKNKNKNKNIDKKDDGKTRKISDMFKKKMIDKSEDEQRKDASKDDKNASPGQNHSEQVPLDSVVTTKIILIIFLTIFLTDILLSSQIWQKLKLTRFFLLITWEKVLYRLVKVSQTKAPSSEFFTVIYLHE